MGHDITFWRGNNLGPGRKEFMKKSLRLEPIEITEEEIAGLICEQINRFIPISKNGSMVRESAKAIISKIKGDE